jgi:hypothetical protein
MILGMSTHVFTLLHVILSLAGIVSGLIAILGLIGNKFSSGMTGFFLVTTALTSITGFLFPIHGITPGLVLGVLSIFVLLVAVVALFVGKLTGGWRGTYVISSSLALYFNVFVLFAQLFAKVPAFKAIAPTQSAPAFGITQLLVMVVFILLTVRAFRQFRSSAHA